MLQIRYASFYMATHEQGEPNPELSGPNYRLLEQIQQVASGRYGPTRTIVEETAHYELSTTADPRANEVHATNLPGTDFWRNDRVRIQNTELLGAADLVLIDCNQVGDDPPEASVTWWSSSHTNTYTEVIVASPERLASEEESFRRQGSITCRTEPSQTSDGSVADLCTMVVFTPDSPTGAEHTRLAAEFGEAAAGRYILNGATEYVMGAVLPAVQQLQQSGEGPDR